MVWGAIIGRIEEMHLEMLHRAESLGLTENFELHLNPAIAQALGLGDSIRLNGADVPVIAEDIIRLENNKSDIYLFDPKWLDEENN